LTVGATLTCNQIMSNSSVQAGECQLSYASGSPESVWYRFTATNDSLVLSHFQTVLGTFAFTIRVYGPYPSGAGCVPNCASAIYNQTQSGDKGTHILLTGLTTSGNNEYLVQIEDGDPNGNQNSAATFCIGINNPASNDNISQASVISECGVTYNGNTTFGYVANGTSTGSNNLDNNNSITVTGGSEAGDDVTYVMNNDSWFKFCSVNGGTWQVTFSVGTCVFSGTNSGAQLAILTGNASNLVNVAQAPSPTYAGQSWTSSNITLSAGDCAYLVVDGFSGDGCTYSYALTPIGSTDCSSISPCGISGSSSVCVGNSITLSTSVSPSASTPWTSSNPAVATVSNIGVVSGISTGTTTITFVAVDGCTSSKVISVIAAPTLCISAFTPLNAATNQTSGGIIINWDDVNNATSYDVYFGAASNPPFVSSVSISEFETGVMSASTTYYWRVVPKNSCGSATCNTVYSFQTGNPCFSNTTQADFTTGTTLTSLDATSSSGNLQLSQSSSQSLDQSQTTISGAGFTSSYIGQTFTAGSTGQLNQVDLYLVGTGTSTVQIRAVVGGVIQSTILGSASVTTSTANWYQVNFSTGISLTSGTQYAIVFVNGASVGWYVCSNGGNDCSGNYTSGNAFTSTNGTTWSATLKDLVFKTYISTSAFASSGNLVSNTFNAGVPACWTLSWSQTLPANTNIEFQVAGSNSSSGPWNFIGPNGTSTTYFSSASVPSTYSFPASLAGMQYVKYKVFLSSTNTNNTPTLADVTICQTPQPTAAISGTTSFCGGSSTTLTASGGGTYLWSPGGATTASISPTTGGNYTVTVTQNGCSSSTVASVTMNSLPVVGISGNTSICSGSSTTLTASGGGTYLWSLNSATTNAITVSAAGNYSVTVTDNNLCSNSANTTVVVNDLTTPTFTALGPYCLNDTPGSLPSPSNNGIAGSWSPSTISTSNAGSASYTFTPTSTAAPTCATGTSISVTVNQAPGIISISPP
jgi:hypothetical protein